MFELIGKYATAKVYASELGEKAESQIINICNQSFSEGSNMCIMPDAHVGRGCVIGTTMVINDKVVPTMVGVDIGCGILTQPLSLNLNDFNEKEKEAFFKKLDTVIRKHIPSGVKKNTHKDEGFNENMFDRLCCIQHIDVTQASLSCGTLGGGNHFIEIAKDEDEKVYLLIHSGSRGFGYGIAEYYDKVAKETCQAISNEDIPFLEGKAFDFYMNDMRIAQEYAALNRKLMLNKIMKHMNIEGDLYIETVHNYIDDNNVLRKGAISAHKDEKILIPMNMRDGSFLCIGKGNPDWNFSAPHGAGRHFSRTQAKKEIDLKAFEESMEGIYSSCITASRIDEAPMAYKEMGEILPHISGTVEIYKHLKTIYNLKA